ncbi:hypothetical protein EG68_04352 [Paragonimus skrjabini miyazakii]|uniref:Uncharacterized protein n=1 Tax=Paragonimus skrjabini miyazakii TaxID=59628 RepID=A0A8S9YYY7_9TREM|nr:hypothetical protein EG68_04352 [Paragonimus skrjabini miyazakii]
MANSDSRGLPLEELLDNAKGQETCQRRGTLRFKRSYQTLQTPGRSSRTRTAVIPLQVNPHSRTYDQRAQRGGVRRRIS